MPRSHNTVLLTLIASLLAGCGSSGADGGSTQPSEPAHVPSGPDARTVTYSCVEGPGGAITVEVSSAAQLADLINGIDVCEFDGGLVEISVEIPCPEGVRTISVVAEAKKLNNQAVIDACAVGS